MKTVIASHNNFDALFLDVLAGRMEFHIPTAYRVTVVTGKTIAKWRMIGREVISLSKDGRGFRLGSGRKTVYILPGQLSAQELETVGAGRMTENRVRRLITDLETYSPVIDGEM